MVQAITAGVNASITGLIVKHFISKEIQVFLFAKIDFNQCYMLHLLAPTPTEIILHTTLIYEV
jgi:hypothetical protein